MFEDVDMDTPPGLGGSLHFSQNILADKVTVHHFTRGTMSSASLDIGCNIARSAINTTGWRRVKSAITQLPRVPYHEYSYSLLPPEVPPREGLSVLDPKEWGAIPTEDEIFATNNLDDFEGTDLTFLSSVVVGLKRPTNSQVDDSLSYRELYATAPSPAPFSEAPPDLRRQIIDLPSLHKVIPEPHFLPPLSLDASSVIQARISPFNKTTPIPIPPHTLVSIRMKLETPYARGAWIIPIRGALPWEGCTAANVVEPNVMQTSSLYPSNLGFINTARPMDIAWVRTSILAFWNFLLHIRQARKLGHISLSFQPSPGVPLRSTRLGSGPLQYNGETATYPSSGRPGTHYDEDKDLCFVDHFKIYCDVGFAMYIRSALDAWFLDGNQIIPNGEPIGSREATEKKRRIRPLEGARIAFVDERSRGLFVS